MTMLKAHGRASSGSREAVAAIQEEAMHVIEADAKFLRAILFMLILSTVAIGAAAAYSAVSHMPPPTHVADAS